MKTSISILIFLFLCGPVGAQMDIDFSAEHLEKKEWSLKVHKEFKTQFAPAFSGLFQNSFNRINDLTKWQNIYDDTDLGIKLSAVIPLKKQWKLKTHYLHSILNLKNRGSGLAAGYSLQLSICYTL
ncbi:hypothetical protein [Gaetbulibacter aestuarii]|uniref:Uncharacterized protein n=1 Tax=Gaetbulibacter aestuarii TaxID=1502358 RepID=A0ABW7N159_9FLAO